MKNEMTIQTYQDGDFDNIIKVLKECFEYGEARRHDPVFSIRTKLELNDDLLFTAKFGDMIVGTVMAGWDGHRGWIHSLAVLPENRKQGVGKALLMKAVAGLEKTGCPKVNLQVVGSNSAVLEFYKKCGFVVEDRISMGKVLPA